MHNDASLSSDGATIHADDKSSREVLIEYMTTLWESERENAERLTRQVELLSGVMIGLLGLGFFSVEWLYNVPSKSILWHPEYTVWMFHVALAVVVLLFALALLKLYYPGPAVQQFGARTATELLEIRPTDAGNPTRLTLIKKLYRAYNYLRVRNEERRNRLRAGRSFFAAGFALLLLILLAYLVLSIAQKSNP